VLDHRLPGIDGLETLTRLKRRDPNVCVVMITAYASVELAVDAMKHGAMDFLRKPVSPESLRGAVAAALHMKSERRGHVPFSPAVSHTPSILHLTLNGFQIERTGEDPASASPYDHVFSVVRFATGERHLVTVTLDPEEVERIARLSRRALTPQGAFWREQAEHFLAAHLWTDGRIPDQGRLTLTNISRDTVDVAAAWSSD
jgi:DNA-binding response OmpR family regulator